MILSENMKILGIETSCDETGLALVEANGGLKTPRFKILKNLVASQIKIHRPFGGVVPNLAKREHLKNLPILLKKLLPTTYHLPPTIDLIAVTVGPGLEPALWTGINFAKTLTNADPTRTNAEKSPRGSAFGLRRSTTLVGVNHLEGHLYSFLLSKKHSNILQNVGMSSLFPAVALIVSGGHTILLKMESLVKWKKLGETRDDAAGEAFDKVARLLKLPYPGGPEIEKLAKSGNPAAINFPRPMIYDKSYDFSFSGLKTAVLYYLRDPKSVYENKFRNFVQFRTFVSRADVAASFQQAAIDVLVAKTIRAAKQFSAKGGSASGGGAIKSILLSGGVASNKLLRKTLKRDVENLNKEIHSHGRVRTTPDFALRSQGGRVAEAERQRRAFRMQFFAPNIKYNLDNAAMIAAAGYVTYLRKKKYKLEAQGNLNL
jgi:N6-L-threonylcarbamoyladenine synthase